MACLCFILLTQILSALRKHAKRVFGFKQVLDSLEDYLKSCIDDILEKDFKRYLDKKYIKMGDVEKIRKDIQPEFSMW